MLDLQISITRPEDGHVVTATLPVTEEEAGRLVDLRTAPTPGVVIAASAYVSEDDVRGLLDILTDMTGGSTGLSGLDPDAPTGLAPDGNDLTDEQLAELNGETA